MYTPIKAKCIDDYGIDNLTLGKEYDILDTDYKGRVEIINDEGLHVGVWPYRLEVVVEEAAS